MPEPIQMTYAELGERLGISAEAARAFAARRNLPRLAREDGRAVVSVDPTVLETYGDRPSKATAVPAPPSPLQGSNPPPAVASAAERRDDIEWLRRAYDEERAERARLMGQLEAAQRGQRELVRLLGLFLESRERERAQWQAELARERADVEERLSAAEELFERWRKVVLAEARIGRGAALERPQPALSAQSPEPAPRAVAPPEVRAKETSAPRPQPQPAKTAWPEDDPFGSGVLKLPPLDQLPPRRAARRRRGPTGEDKEPRAPAGLEDKAESSGEEGAKAAPESPIARLWRRVQAPLASRSFAVRPADTNCSQPQRDEERS